METAQVCGFPENRNGSMRACSPHGRLRGPFAPGIHLPTA
ncbi:hypothetical protein NMD1_02424 [Novosphingobium sp. MD-1]|nr:hypothetical protein NMD1_02424 [Novosphingobium sp. MD-1]